jgi:hypothetical protein
MDKLRGPGSWLAVRPHEVFEPASTSPRWYFDPSTRAGKMALGAASLLVAVAAIALARRSGYLAALLVLDALPLYALFLTGQGRALAPDLASSPVRFFDVVQRELSRRSPEGLRVIPRLRLPRGSADADELRLTVLPKRALPGLGSFEVAVAPELGPGGWILLPEILLRVRVGSPSHEAAKRLGPHGLAKPGRKPDEVVLAFAPKLPTAKLTAELCRALLETFSASEGAPPVEPERPVQTRRKPVRARDTSDGSREAARVEADPIAV